MVAGILITQWTVTGVVMLSLCGTFVDTAGCSGRKGGGTSCAVRFAESQDKTWWFSSNCNCWANQTLEIGLTCSRHKSISYLYELWICIWTILDWAFGIFRHKSPLRCVCEICLNISKLIFACVQQWQMASLWIFSPSSLCFELTLDQYKYYQKQLWQIIGFWAPQFSWSSFLVPAPSANVPKQSQFSFLKRTTWPVP